METIDRTILKDIVQRAVETVNKYGDGENHTVGSAIFTADGTIYSGVNLYHFTGGPCAELVVLSKMVSEGGSHPLAIAAVGDRGRGLIPPCGRCRQVLADYCPEIGVVLEDHGEPALKPLRALLPDAFVWGDQ